MKHELAKSLEDLWSSIAMDVNRLASYSDFLFYSGARRFIRKLKCQKVILFALPLSALKQLRPTGKEEFSRMKVEFVANIAGGVFDGKTWSHNVPDLQKGSRARGTRRSFCADHV